MQETPGTSYRFGPFIVDSVQHTVSRDGEPVPLTPKTFDLLLLLLENQGRLLTKDELMKTLWPDSFVDESNLTQQISMVRKALGQKSGEEQYIVTVPARGYRFTAPVAVRGKEETRPSQPAPLTRRSHGWAVTAGLVLMGALAVGWLSSRGAKAVPPRSLAILPFQSLKADPDSDFLGFSLADAVITKLDYVSSLTVRPSSAVQPYRQGSIDLPRVAANLHVDTVLTGNFLRDGDDLRITS